MWPGGAEPAEAARRAAAHLDRTLLLVGILESRYWGWLGGPQPSADLRGLLAGLELPDATQLSLGDPGLGAAGFRASHRQAQHAQVAGEHTGRAVTHYDDVALEALAGHDRAAARAFVARELGDLDADDRRAGRLRQTLLAWFRAGHNAAAAAAVLGVHEQTVANRLRAVEDRTGRPPAERRAELEMALRLRVYLG